LQCLKDYKPYTLAGLEPGIFRSGDGRGDHYATPPGLTIQFFISHQIGQNVLSFVDDALGSLVQNFALQNFVVFLEFI
jgi:hypothetical protein